MTDIKEHMEVIGADGVHVGAVDKVEGGRIKLTKKDSGEVRGNEHTKNRGEPPRREPIAPVRNSGHGLAMQNRFLSERMNSRRFEIAMDA